MVLSIEIVLYRGAYILYSAILHFRIQWERQDVELSGRGCGKVGRFEIPLAVAGQERQCGGIVDGRFDSGILKMLLQSVPVGGTDHI